MKNLIIIGVLLFGGSCKRVHQYEVFGKVINEKTGEVIPDAIVLLQDDIGIEDPFFETSQPEKFVRDTSDVYGSYSMKIRTENTSGVLSVSHPMYEFKVKSGGSSNSWMRVTEEIQEITLKMKGLAYFKGRFKSINALAKDSMFISLLSYDDLERTYWDRPRALKIGQGPHYFYDDGRSIYVNGDEYFRYKIEFQTDGVWTAKIDSVLIPTSTEAYDEIIEF